MPLFNVTFTDIVTERTVTYDVETEEEANAQARAAFARLGEAWDGKVSLAPEPPPTLLDKDNINHPNYTEFADINVPDEVAPEAPADVPADE